MKKSSLPKFWNALSRASVCACATAALLLTAASHVCYAEPPPAKAKPAKAAPAKPAPAKTKAAPAQPAGDTGSITMSPTGEIIAGSRITLTFTYTVGADGIKKGGGLRITTPNDGWSFPLVPMHRNFLIEQQHMGKDNGYVSYARRDVRAELTTSATKAWIHLDAQQRGSVGKLRMASTRHIVATVRDADLAPGDKITIIYGDTSMGEPGALVQQVAPSDDDHFGAFVDIAGTDQFVRLESDDFNKLRVMPGPVSLFNVVAPAKVRPGETFRVRISGMDACRNRATGAFTGALLVYSTQPGITAPAGGATLTAADNNHCVVEGFKATAEGVYRIVVELPDKSKRWVSNPIWCTSKPGNIYFGDFHCHGKWHTDSIGTPDELYEYGRDIAGLDFMGVTDMYGYRKDGWQDTVESTGRHYAPGRFATFKGFEYGGDVGHRNIIYRDCVLEPEIKRVLPMNNVPKLFEYFQGKNVIMIPHHTKVWTQWEYHDPVLEPIVEAYSCWGSGVERVDPLWRKAVKPESGVYTALERGYKLGFIGSGDSHSGMPGRSFPADRQFCVDSKSGFACVMADELTREKVFDAFRARKCYATTGARMILEFSVNGTDMGQEASVADAKKPRRLSVHAIGDELVLMRILKNNKEIARREIGGGGSDEAVFEYSDTEPAKNGDFYFVRVEQKDANTAWSSPVWIKLQ